LDSAREFVKYNIMTTRLIYPRKNTMEDVITSLRNKGGPVPALKQLSLAFSDDNFNASIHELQEAILENKMSTSSGVVKIRSFTIQNKCLDREIHRQCHEFCLRCLEGPQNKILDFRYSSRKLLRSLVDANRIADAIATNDNIRMFGIDDASKRGIFCNEGTFGCILNAVLKAGVHTLQLRSRTYNGIVKCGCFGGENLATNTTLKGLYLYYGHAAGEVHHPMDVYDKQMEQLGTILKVNRGLIKIYIYLPIISNTGRQHLLESLRDNTTLLKLQTKRPPIKIGIHPAAGEEEEEEEDELVRDESISIQSQIDHHMMLNNIWKRYNDNNNNRTASAAAPKKKDLIAATNVWFKSEMEDKSTVTNNFLYSAIQQKFECRMTKQQKRIVRKRLARLVTKSVNGNENNNDTTSDDYSSNTSIDDDNNEEAEESEQEDDIPLNVYPNLLEKFAKKPLLLYLFLQKNQPRIFTDFSDPSRKRRRRCSMRILAKKRRVLEAA
jgi:hypothetical protein